jgi:ABC-2 type transport system ATP-binding protein
MQQKIQFIGTVLHEPEIIILDEPFSGFDPINAQLLTDEILLLKEKGATIIFSTHRMDSVELLCDQIALINLAEKILDGNVPDLKERFKKNQFELSFTGQINLENLPLEMVSVVQKNDLNIALVKAKELMSNKQMIQLLLNTDINLISFAEKLPSMEEIFIEAVQQKNN